MKTLKLQNLAVLGLMVLFCGCGQPQPIPVSGEVTLDGAPLEGAAVMFAPVAGGRPVTGTTDAQGKFQLTTITPNDGAVPGEYRVTVIKQKTEFDLQPDKTYQERVVSLVPDKYGRAETSGLTAAVSRTTTNFKFDLSSK